MLSSLYIPANLWSKGSEKGRVAVQLSYPMVGCYLCTTVAPVSSSKYKKPEAWKLSLLSSTSVPSPAPKVMTFQGINNEVFGKEGKKVFSQMAALDFTTDRI